MRKTEAARASQPQNEPSAWHNLQDVEICESVGEIRVTGPADKIAALGPSGKQLIPPGWPEETGPNHVNERAINTRFKSQLGGQKATPDQMRRFAEAKARSKAALDGGEHHSLCAVWGGPRHSPYVWGGPRHSRTCWPRQASRKWSWKSLRGRRVLAWLDRWTPSHSTLQMQSRHCRLLPLEQKWRLWLPKPLWTLFQCFRTLRSTQRIWKRDHRTQSKEAPAQTAAADGPGNGATASDAAAAADESMGVDPGGPARPPKARAGYSQLLLEVVVAWAHGHISVQAGGCHQVFLTRPVPAATTSSKRNVTTALPCADTAGDLASTKALILVMAEVKVPPTSALPFLEWYGFSPRHSPFPLSDTSV
eukprot:5786467-Amphidinium_carterae.2